MQMLSPAQQRWEVPGVIRWERWEWVQPPQTSPAVTQSPRRDAARGVADVSESPEPGCFGLGHRDAEEAMRLQSSFLALQMKDLIDGDLPAPQHAPGDTSPQLRFSCSRTKSSKPPPPDTAQPVLAFQVTLPLSSLSGYSTQTPEGLMPKPIKEKKKRFLIREKKRDR